VPTQDPGYDRLPWAKTGLIGWGAALLLGPLLGSLLVGAGVSYFEAQRGRKAAVVAAPGGAAAGKAGLSVVTQAGRTSPARLSLESAR
jgi:hypothetical protein